MMEGDKGEVVDDDDGGVDEKGWRMSLLWWMEAVQSRQ